MCLKEPEIPVFERSNYALSLVSPTTRFHSSHQPQREELQAAFCEIIQQGVNLHNADVSEIIRPAPGLAEKDISQRGWSCAGFVIH